MTKGQHAYELRTLRGDRSTWAEIATLISSTEEGARRVAKHYARTNGLPPPERYGDGTRRAASVLAERPAPLRAGTGRHGPRRRTRRVTRTHRRPRPTARPCEQPAVPTLPRPKAPPSPAPRPPPTPTAWA